MVRATKTEKLAALQRNAANIRNICMLAHVDHGKTTLADVLVASNGIISQRMAGKLRYLDSREDEQARGITMKSSAISLQYDTGGEEYLINMIDSPGHIDFSSEVSTAVRLCDGAIVLIDVVEGVCPQTQAVLRQVWIEGIKPVLVLNKLDRLITELKLKPQEAYHHLLQILEKVNAVMGELFGAEVMEKSSRANGSSSALDEADDSNLYFSPEQGNVVFASAVDTWGFRIKQFAEFYSTKLGINSDVLHNTLWGDFYLDSKTKTVRKGAQKKGKKPMFVQCVLENIWAVYEAVLINKDKDKTERIVKSLNLTVRPRDLRSTDCRVRLQAICNEWLPLADSLLAMVVDKLPGAGSISSDRVHKLLYSAVMDPDTMPEQTQGIRKAFLDCDASQDAPVIVYVSKMLAFDKKALPQNRRQTLTPEQLVERGKLAREQHAERIRKREMDINKTGSTTTINTLNKTGSSGDPAPDVTSSSYLTDDQSAPDEVEDTNTPKQVFIAFARVFSGTVRPGQELLVLGPKYNPLVALEKVNYVDNVTSLTADDLCGLRHVSRATVTDVYMLMGRELEILGEVPAGNILGIGGLASDIISSATVSSTLACPAFTEMFFDATPILHVAIEPKNTGDMGALLAGLRLLNQADACVQVLVQETGEHVIVAAGEIHLQKCLEDLTTRFAKIEVNVSAPIVPFRETIVRPPTTDLVNEAILECNQANTWQNHAPLDEGRIIDIDTGVCRLKIRAIPLPEDATKLIEGNLDVLKIIAGFSGRKSSRPQDKLSAHMCSRVTDFKGKLASVFGHSVDWREDIVDKIWAFGPRLVGPNILCNHTEESRWPTLWDCLGHEGSSHGSWDVMQGIINGFQLATQAGPLCEEPMRGVCFAIEHIQVSLGDGSVTESLDTSCDQSSSVTKSVNTPCDQSSSVTKSLGDQSSSVTQSLDTPCDQSSSVTQSLGDQSSDDVSVDPVTRPTSLAYTGQLMSSVKDACRLAFQAQPQRMVAVMYSCVIQATADVLGKMYAALGKRHGRVLKEDLLEGWSLFSITAALPMVESFGFVTEIRKRTSGLASPQLRFSHWEVVDMDPFWVPTTQEEYLHFGEKADSENIACKYMNDVRRRKGLKVDEKIVQFAEKQRTLSKNK